MKTMAFYPTIENLNQINTHRAVCSYFLKKHLSKYYSIVSSKELLENNEFLKILRDKDRNSLFLVKDRDNIFSAVASAIEKSMVIAGEEKVDYLFSTIQAGICKMEWQKVKGIKQMYPNLKTCSIHDHWGSKKFNEDFLFIAHPNVNDKTKQKLISGSNNKNICPVYMGWCADHDLFKHRDNSTIGIVLDHSALQSFRKDLTDRYIEALSIAKKHEPRIAVCRLNRGFEFYDFNKGMWTRDESLRWWEEKCHNDMKITNGNGATIFQIAECLNNSNFFYITHVESCGLTGVEALMAGCKLYIPSGTDKFMIWGKEKPDIGNYNGTYIKQIMLKDYMNYRIFEDTEKHIEKFILDDIRNIKVDFGRDLLIRHNSWSAAADRIYAALEGR